MTNAASPEFDVHRHLTEIETKGFTIVEDFLTSQDLLEERAGLAPYLGSHAGRNNFEGYKTERVYSLVGRGKLFENIAEDRRVLALIDRLPQPGYLLTASQAICIHSGETAQPIHFDDTNQ